MEKAQKLKSFSLIDTALVGMMAAFICVCSLITIPGPVPFTMQLFGVYCALGFLGGRNGTLSVVIYILLGLVGLPVFAGFKSGPGTLFGATGGYIFGFAVAGLVYWLLNSLLGEKLYFKFLSMLLSLLVCYATGTAWFVFIYSRNVEKIGVVSALWMCVIPFIIPDLIKISLALLVSSTAKTAVKKVKKD